MGRITLFFLCAFVGFLPFEMMAVFEDLPSGGKQLGLLMVSMAILAFLSGHRIRLLSLPMVLRTVLVLYAAMSLGWSLAPERTMATIPRITQLLIFVLVIWEFAVTAKDQAWILRSMLLGMLVPLLMAFAARRGASSIEAESGMRFSGGGQDLNYLAYMYSVSILVAVYLATNSSPVDRFCRWFYWGLAVLCALGTFLTGSRGGFVSLVTAGVFAMILAGMARRRILTVLQILAVAVFIYVLVQYVVPVALLNRVTQEQSVEADPRAVIWARGWAAFLQSPILGVGAGAYGLATAVSGERASVAHNTFLSVLVELGVIGIALYLTYTVMLFRAAWRLPRREKLLWTGVLVVWFLSANSAGSQIDKFSWFVHVMVLVQAAASVEPAGVRKRRPYPNLDVPIVRKLMPPRFGKP